MATVSDITVTPLAGLNHIDALLDKGPDWNYLSNSGANVLFYTFSTSSGNEAGKTGQETFSVAQQAATRTAFTYLQQITGIEFRETTSGTGAQIHLANLNLDGSNTTGLCSWQASYGYAGADTLTQYSANAYVYLDNVEWRAANQNLTPGGQGYETLLHELGHALGLKHPFFENNGEQQVVLPLAEDNTSNTIMSYTQSGGHRSAYSPYDVAALNWLYGADGLRGALGINGSGGRYITGSDKSETLTGTQFNDTLQGNGGDDMIDGGAGTDTVLYKDNRAAYTFGNLADGALTVSSAAEGFDTLRNIEWLSFADITVARANLVDTTPPPVPTMAVTKNGDLYARGDRPNLNGSAEPFAKISVYIGDRVIATAQADANGLWNTRVTEPLADGMNYQAYAVATDAAGNVSKASDISVFHIDATAPAYPTITGSLATGSNQPLFGGTGEAGTTIELYNSSNGITLGATRVDADGNWAVKLTPLPNGTYDVGHASLDLAGNASSSGQSLVMTINNADNKVGTAGADKFVMGPANIAVDGGAGIDTVVFNGNRADYTVTKGTWGHAVSDANGGIDGLYNVERIQFNDGWLAIDESSSQVFRLYQAAFNRASDDTGMGYWIDRAEKGASLLTIATEFTVGQAEFDKIYGVNPSNEVFITNLYQNVLKRNPDADGFAYWLTRVDNSSKGQILMEFSESPENQALVVDTTSTGIPFTPKIEVVGSSSFDLAAGPLVA